MKDDKSFIVLPDKNIIILLCINYHNILLIYDIEPKYNYDIKLKQTTRSHINNITLLNDQKLAVRYQKNILNIY